MKIKIDGWKCNLTFSSAHFLAGYSNCSQLHGHTYAVHVVVEGKIVKELVIDFRVVKKTIRKIIDKMDHKMIIPTNGKFDIKKAEDIEITYGNKRYIFPKDDCIFLPIYSSSAESFFTPYPTTDCSFTIFPLKRFKLRRPMEMSSFSSQISWANNFATIGAIMKPCPLKPLH